MPKIYRIRYIPSETVDLSFDTMLFRNHQYLITEWVPIKPRNDIAHGISCVFLEHGWKISAMMDQNKRIKYWYCDVIDIDYDKAVDAYYLYDLLIDVKIKDGRPQVLDLDELALAFEKELITKEQVSLSLKRTDSLLKLIHSIEITTYVKSIIKNLTDREC